MEEDKDQEENNKDEQKDSKDHEEGNRRQGQERGCTMLRSLDMDVEIVGEAEFSYIRCSWYTAVGQAGDRNCSAAAAGKGEGVEGSS